MKKALISLVFLSLTDIHTGIAFQGITQDLEREMTLGETGFIPVNIILREKADFQSLHLAMQGIPNRVQRKIVWEEIQKVANSTQKPLRNFLAWKEREGKVRDVKILWTANGISAHVERSIIEEIWRRFSEVKSIDLDETRPLEEVADFKIPLTPFNKGGSKGDFAFIPADTAWGVVKINAPQVWEMGYTGAGILVGNIDTGVNYNHLDLSDHLWEGDTTYPNHGWDYYSNDNDPMDESGHGTSTAGIVCGDGTAGFLTGVAPDATLMILRASGAGSTESMIWLSMDFCIQNGVDIITSSLSWKFPWNPDYETWRLYTEAELSAGIVHSNSIGNQGNQQGTYPIPYNIATPGNCPSAWLHPDQILIGGLSSTMGCGAVDQNDEIMDYSGRGPAAWETGPLFTDYPYFGGVEMGLLKPDVSAPTDVETIDYSCDTCYTTGFGGTSAATPHVGGSLALLLSVDSTLTPEDVTRMLQLTAVDLGAPGKDNEYGAGRIDVYQAVMSIVRSNILLLNYAVNDSSGDNDMRPEPGETVSLIVTLENREPWHSATGVSVILRTNDSTLSLTDSLSDFGTIPSGGTADNLLDPFTFFVNPSNPHWTTFTLEISATPPSLTTSETISLLIGHPPIILVDDDGGVNLESYYKEPLDNLNLIYDEWEVETQGVPPSTGAYGLNQHSVVIWFTGNDSTTLTPVDTTVLRDFLQTGGKLFLSSQNLGEEIGSQPFYSTYLRAQFLDPNADDNLLSGVTGDEISDGINVVIQGMNGAGNADSEDRISPLSGADSVFSYTTAFGTSAIKYDSGTYKLVYFAFPFEAIHGAGSFASRDTVMYRVLYWLDPSIVGVEEKANYQLPITNFQLFQNSPNPFHHSTTIRYTLPGVRDQGSGFSGTIRVKLAIYDITGRLVETLVDERQKPGVYQVEWDGRIGVSPVPSGIYFYRLTIGGLDSSSPNTTTKKLILLR